MTEHDDFYRPSDRVAAIDRIHTENTLKHLEEKSVAESFNEPAITLSEQIQSALAKAKDSGVKIEYLILNRTAGIRLNVEHREAMSKNNLEPQPETLKEFIGLRCIYSNNLIYDFAFGYSEGLV